MWYDSVYRLLLHSDFGIQFLPNKAKKSPFALNGQKNCVVLDQMINIASP